MINFHMKSSYVYNKILIFEKLYNPFEHKYISSYLSFIFFLEDLDKNIKR